MQLRAVGFLEIGATFTSSAERQGLSYDMPIVQAAWRLDGDQVDVQLPFVIEISALEDEQPVSLARVGVTVFITYAGAANATEDDLRHFVGISGFMHAWPYLRAEAQALTSKIGLPPLLLPLVVSGAVPSKVKIGPPLSAPAAPPKKLKAKATRRAPAKTGKSAKGSKTAARSPRAKR